MGVVGSIVGQNFPQSLAVGKVVPAQTMDTCLVLKSSEFISLSAN